MIRFARWTAIAIGLAALIDPRISLPRSQRPVVRVVSPESRDLTPVVAALRDAGFTIDPAAREAATVFVGSELDASHSRRGVLWGLDTTPRAPNVRLVSVSAAAVRLPGEAVDVRVEIAAAGATGKTTEVVLAQSGIPVASATHTWTAGEDRWNTTLRYLPPTVAIAALRVQVSAVPGETSTEDNAADVAAPAARGPVRVLIFEAAVTWPAVFVRRALEGEPSVTVSALQRAAKSVSTRAGAPPQALTRSTLESYEAVVIGGPEELRGSDLDALRWFVEQRGGVAVFIPDRPPSGRYLDLVGTSSFAARALDAPARLGARLQASELVVPAQLPPAATVLAAVDEVEAPVVFSARRGRGAIVFSGALDAWRQRGDDFAAFWRGLLLANAAAVPPPLEVTADPALVRPGDRSRVIARIRDLGDNGTIATPPLRARVVSPDAKLDEPLRLWPTAEPGVFEGEWRARTAGLYNVSVSGGELRSDAAVSVVGDALRASGAGSEGLALAAAATGGRSFPLGETAALVGAMRQTHAPQRIVRTARPMRSPWWAVPFAVLLCGEWAVRRKRGLP